MWSKISYLSTNTNDSHIQQSKKPFSCKSICIITALIFTLSILVITYFTKQSSKNLDSLSPAQNLLTKHDYDEPPSIPLPSDTNDEIDSFYPTEITLDANRIITPSDTTKTSSFYKSNGHDDQIKTMPHLVESTCTDSPTNCGFDQYSGYLLANNNREIHYWFIESEYTPHNNPVFIWTNGGPGCSGMDGLLTEHGPWKTLNNGRIGYNKYSWINEVNMLYLEQPYGVGFSCTNIGQNVIGGDQNAADDMDAVIRDFINKFPMFKKNKFYLSSESWGGHYVPITTYTILQNNDNGVKPYINFGGFLLGNPSTDPYENKYGFVGDIYGHGLLKSTDWYTWRDECWNNPEAIDTSDVCAAIHTRAYYSAFNANVYALDYPQCYDDEDWSSDFHNKVIESSGFMKNANLHHSARLSMQRVLNSNDYDGLKMGHIKRSDLQQLHDKINTRLTHKTTVKTQIIKNKLPIDETIDSNEEIPINEYEPCIEHFMEIYLNLPEVQGALNVKPVEWEMCSDAVWYAWPESDFQAHIEPYYTQIIDKYVDKLGLVLTVYSGDDDSVCGLEGTMYWLDRFNMDVNDDIQWEQWNDEQNQMGGYYTQYMDNKGNVGLHFITVRSAGHMVPTTQPSRALIILRKYLNDFVK
eukprot:487290_1